MRASDAPGRSAGDTVTLNRAESQAVQAHRWLLQHGGSGQWEHVPWHLRRGVRTLLRRGLLTMTPGGVVAVPGKL